MNRTEALKIVKEQLPKKRYEHTLGVEATAIQLAKMYGADVEKASLAALLHDYAKYYPVEEMKAIILAEQLDQRLLSFHYELWHAPVGAWLMLKKGYITDEDILNAIRYHTTGRRNMSLLEKIIYLADYIEPGRSFPGVDEVRALAKVDLNKALLQAVTNTVIFLATKQQLIFPDTLGMYNELLIQEGANDR